jgi:hypothetical protein
VTDHAKPVRALREQRTLDRQVVLPRSPWRDTAATLVVAAAIVATVLGLVLAGATCGAAIGGL